MVVNKRMKAQDNNSIKSLWSGAIIEDQYITRTIRMAAIKLCLKSGVCAILTVIVIMCIPPYFN